MNYCSFSAHFLTLSKRQQRIANPSGYNNPARVQISHSPQEKHQAPLEIAGFLFTLYIVILNHNMSNIGERGYGNGGYTFQIKSKIT